MAFIALQYLLLIKLLALKYTIASTPINDGDDVSSEAGGGGAKMVSDSCPINQHAVCNEHTKATKCVCGMYETANPPPERSCTTLLNITGHSQLEAVSAKIRLGETLLGKHHGQVDNFLEQSFVDALSKKFQIEKRNIIVLRLKCVDEPPEGAEKNDHDIVIQFVILRRGRRPEMAPFRKSDLLLADTIASRIRNSRELDNIGGFSIVNIEKVNELLPLENDLDNSLLITEAIIAGLFILSCVFCACCIFYRRRQRPEAKGYEATPGPHTAEAGENNNTNSS